MGNACGGSAGRVPSSLKLCRELTCGPDRSAGLPRRIFEYCSPEELRLLGDVVYGWARGNLSGSEARRMLQARIHRANSCIAARSRSSGGPTGSGSATGSAFRGRSPFSSDSVLGEASGMLVAVSPGDLSVILVSRAPPRFESNLLFNFIDDVLVHSATIEDGWGVVMREVGLDGPRPLHSEVRERFRERADEILAGEDRQTTQVVSTRLELLKLCLCVEVLRHVCPPTRGRSPTPTKRVSANHTASSLAALSVLRQVQDSALSNSLGPRSGSVPVIRLDQTLLQLRVFMLLNAAIQEQAGHLDHSSRGLMAEDVQRLCPVVVMPSSAALGDEETCCVCLEPMGSGQELRKLPCKHLLHKECCEAWLGRADTCPACRANVAPRGTGNGSFSVQGGICL